MDTTTQPALTTKTTRGRQWRTNSEKRRIVEETLAPGASVALVARAHGVNANQVFQWRRLYHSGLLSVEESAAAVIAGDGDSHRAKLLPVVVSEASAGKPESHSSSVDKRAQAAAEATGPALVELKLAKGQVRIAGRVDPGVLRVVLECLLG
jgi:transposase